MINTCRHTHTYPPVPHILTHVPFLLFSKRSLRLRAVIDNLNEQILAFIFVVVVFKIII